MNQPQLPNQNPAMAQPGMQIAPPRRSPVDTARVFALWVRAVCIWCFWSVVGAVALTGAFVAVRCVWSFAQIVLQAVGVQ